MEELAKKLEEIGKAFADFKTLNDNRLKAIESKGYAPADAVEKVEKANAEITKLQEQYKAMETAMSRGSHGAGAGAGAGDEKAAKYKEAFVKWSKGQISDVELKAMSVDSDVDGGFLVTPEMSAEIVKKEFESSPLRMLASVQTIGSDQLDILEDLDEVQSGWVTETQGRTNTATAQLKMVKIPTHELYASPLITQKLLDDAAFNVESWLQGKIAEKFSRDEATAFVRGDGMGKPKGILSYGAGTGFGLIAQIGTGVSQNIGADGLILQQGSIKESYQKNASWLMQRLTVVEVRKLKDAQGRYLWEPSLVPGNPDMLLGKPIYQANDMDAIGANKLAVAYGDFKAGYQIVDRIGIRVLRDVYSAKPFVMFYTTKRVGGGVKNFEAINLGKCGA